MGSRADYYVGRGAEAEWLGSVAYDGYDVDDGRPVRARDARNESEWRLAVDAMIRRRDDGTAPEQGWPWPWETSRNTDYAYTFVDGAVLVSCFGHHWSPLGEEHDDGPQDEVFPDMSARQRVTFGPRSGVLLIGVR